MSDLIAFYWTFSVKRVGFKSLSVYDVDAAAAKSKSIRYQRDRIRSEYAEAYRQRSLHEVAYIEQSDDRPTGGAEQRLIEAIEYFRLKDTPTIVLVDFTKIEGWRPQKALFLYIKKHWKLLPVEPEAIYIDGVLFRPAEHFKQSRERIERDRAVADIALLQAAQVVPSGRGQSKAIARLLAEQKSKTQHGKEWTADNVRKRLPFVKKKYGKQNAGDPPQKTGHGGPIA